MLKVAMEHYLSAGSQTADEVLRPEEKLGEISHRRQLLGIGPTQLLEMPLGAKLPLLPGSNTLFYRTNLGEKRGKLQVTMQSSSAQVTMMESQNRKRAPAWTEREVRDLIAVWGEESVLSELRSSFRNAKTFVKISQGMKDRGHNRDPKQCRVKLKELRQAYQKTREANSRSGSEPQTCRFYDELHAILGGSATTTPAVLFNSFNGDGGNTEAGFGDEEDDDEEEVVDSSQQASGETGFPDSQELFLTLDLEPVPPEPTQGCLLDPAGGEGTSAALTRRSSPASTMNSIHNFATALYQPPSGFDLGDPYCRLMTTKYRSLHDPHLRSYYKRKNNLRRLKKGGYVTNDNKVVCTLKEFNEYRQYLTTLKLEFEKNYMREQKMLEKQVTKLQDPNLLPEGADTSHFREWLLREERENLQDRERQMRNRYKTHNNL
ncbi:unnamed protein product [Lepidochelys olivacea]